MSRTYRIDPLHPFRLVCTSCAEAVLELPPGASADVPTGDLTRQQVLDLWPDLEDEQANAVCEHDWWGVGLWSVWQWRKALGVGITNEGTSRLRSAYSAEPWAEQARAKAQDPERCAKIAAARRGKPRPPEVREAIGAAQRGKPLSAEHRRKLSEAQRRRGARPPKAGRPWTTEEDEFLSQLLRGTQGALALPP